MRTGAGDVDGTLAGAAGVTTTAEVAAAAGAVWVVGGVALPASVAVAGRLLLPPARPLPVVVTAGFKLAVLAAGAGVRLPPRAPARVAGGT
jgi:hypothetical protein